MINTATLDEYLEQWAREYGPGGYPNERSRNMLQTLIDHKGFVPSAQGYKAIPLGTVADEVESAVLAMALNLDKPGEPNECYRASACLRVCYLSPKHWPESERLDKLKRLGLPMSRDSYYRHLNLGLAMLKACLGKKIEETSCVAT